MLDRIRHTPLLVLLPPIILFIAGMVNAEWRGVDLVKAGVLFGALAIAVAAVLCMISGPIALIGFYLIVLGALSYLAAIVLDGVFGFGGGGGLTLAMVLVFGAGFAAALLRSPFRHRFGGEVVIDKPRREVWDALYVQPTTKHWKPHVRKVEAVPGKPDHFNHYYQTSSAAAHDDEPQVQMKLSDVTKGRSFTVESVPTEENNTMNGVSDRQTYTLEDAGSGTRVTSVEVLENAPVSLVVMSVLIRPVQDGLRQLKSILENTDDTTIASAFYSDYD